MIGEKFMDHMSPTIGTVQIMENVLLKKMTMDLLLQNANAIPKVTLDFRILEPIYLRNYGDMLVSV